MTYQEPDSEVDRIAHLIIGAAIDVHKALGPGFLEAVYEKALCIELGYRKINYSQQHPIQLLYRGQNIGEGRLDILVEHRLIVELKAVEQLLPIHTAQVISYLKATEYPLGLLINFNVPILKQGIKRIILT